MSNSIVIKTLYKKVESLKRDLRNNNNMAFVPFIERDLKEAENFLNNLVEATETNSNVLVLTKTR